MSEQPPTAALFDQWASVYDTNPNPLLALESRCLPQLFPPIAGTHILDAGCGTGRWLAHLEPHAPATLTGCDPSASMLDNARARLRPTTHLYPASCARLPAKSSSKDLILCSFVLSYLDHLDDFAAECARALRQGGTLLLSDMHPVTAAQRGWTRSFRVAGQTIEIPAHTRSLAQIISAFVAHGLTLIEMEHPAFAEPERALFEQANKLSEYNQLVHVPAIYLLKLQKPQPDSVPCIPTNTLQAISSSTWHSTASPSGNPSQILDLTGYVLLPGLVNTHDHLEFALFPNLGRSSYQQPFTNSPEWAHEIHRTHAEVIAQHQAVPLATRLAFGGLRNLLAGVTTVCHHNPLHPELLGPDFPVRVVQDFAWAHSLTFDSNLQARFTESPSDHPFILHAAEGTDRQSRSELDQLDKLNLVTSRTVLVHGLALVEEDIALLNDRGASLILCPTSNRFLFHQIPPASRILAIDRVALASDSSLTAAGDLLDELRALHALPPELLYTLVTSAAAEILHLPGTPTDLIAVPERPGLSPAETLAQLTLADVELVLLGGRVQLASSTLYARLSPSVRKGLHLLEIDGLKRWVRAPLSALFASAEAVLGLNNLRLGNKEVRYLASA